MVYVGLNTQLQKGITVGHIRIRWSRLVLGCPKNVFRHLYAAALSGYVDTNMKF